MPIWRYNKYMNNKKFLYGVGLGVLACNVYPLVKEKVHPIAVKIVGGAIATASTTKSFIEGVNEKAMEGRQERFRRSSENFETKSTNSTNEMSENIETLKKQLEELKNKLEGQ